jgi:hypothetical protein
MPVDLKELKRVLKYDPKTGLWTNRVWRGGTAFAGQVTGRPNSDGYIQICFQCKRYMSSRLAYFYMTGEWPEFEMDHKDLDRRNNRWSNLRPATDSQNQMNRPLQSNNKSSVKGVRRHGKGWGACISLNKTKFWLGTFKTKREAIKVRQQKERVIFGEFVS